MPVFIVGTYDENGVPDAMNAAWGGIADKEPDKVAKCGLHPVKSEFVNAPYFEELKMSLDCTVISYNPETCCLIGEIVNVNADESVLDEKGAIDQTKLEPISYDPVKHLYVRLGETVGRAFHDGRKFK